MKALNVLLLIICKCESWGLEFRLKEAKDTYKTHRSNTHVVDHDSVSLDDEEKGVYAAEFVWPSKDKTSTCASLKPIHKNRQNEMKFTFDVSKCDRIFLMSYLKMETFICLMLYHRRKN